MTIDSGNCFNSQSKNFEVNMNRNRNYGRHSRDDGRHRSSYNNRFEADNATYPSSPHEQTRDSHYSHSR